MSLSFNSSTAFHDPTLSCFDDEPLVAMSPQTTLVSHNEASS